jgi:membrane-bound inhibitor of C-type lysozyme
MFGGDEDQPRLRTPPGAIAYQCDGGKRLYVRYLDNGDAWVIFPDREFRLKKTSSGAGASGASYGNGETVLDVKNTEAALIEGATTSYANCKADPA